MYQHLKGERHTHGLAGRIEVREEAVAGVLQNPPRSLPHEFAKELVMSPQDIRVDLRPQPPLQPNRIDDIGKEQNSHAVLLLWLLLLVGHL